MKKGIVLVFALSLVAALLASGIAIAAPAGKVDVCHREGNGSYHLINVSENALPAHLAHGDGLPGDPVPGMEGKKFAEDCTVVDAGPIVTVGENATPTAGMRIKGSPGPDVYLGVEDLGVGTNRVQADAGNPLPDGTYGLTFGFDQVANAITLVGPGTVNLTYDFDEKPAPSCAPADWDAMIITVRDSRNNGGAGLQNVMLDGFSLGNFAPPDGTPDVSGTPGYQHWTVTGFDFSQSFMVQADLAVANLTANESLKVEIRVGCTP